MHTIINHLSGDDRPGLLKLKYKNRKVKLISSCNLQATINAHACWKRLGPIEFEVLATFPLGTAPRVVNLEKKMHQ